MSVPYSVYKTLPRSAQMALKKDASKGGQAAPKRSYTRGARAPKLYVPAAVKTYAPRVESRGSRYAKYAATGLASLAAMTPAIMKVAGYGDYAPINEMPHSNSFMKELMTNGPPAIHTTKQRSFVIRHREYLGDVTTASTPAFNIANYPINPGMSATFPWLSTIAQNFEQYSFRGLLFEFKSTSSDALNSTNTALGSVIMATEYNVDSDPFTSKIQMENKEFANSARQSCSIIHAVECDRSRTPISELFVRTGALPSGQDLKFADLGRFSIATVGQQGTDVNIGELWCTYEVELLKPQVPDPDGGVPISFSDRYQCSGNVDNTNFFGDTQTSVTSQIGVTIATNQIQFPFDIISGQYMVVINWHGDSSACNVPNVSQVGCNRLSLFINDTQDYAAPVGGSSTSLPLVLVVDITAGSATIDFASGTGSLPTTIDYVDVLVTRTDF